MPRFVAFATTTEPAGFEVSFVLYEADKAAAVEEAESAWDFYMDVPATIVVKEVPA